jgi:thymidine kinase
MADDPDRIREIKHCFNVDEANRYLQNQWVYLTSVADDKGDIVTVVGWTKDQSSYHPTVPVDVVS